MPEVPLAEFPEGVGVENLPGQQRVAAQLLVVREVLGRDLEERLPDADRFG